MAPVLGALFAILIGMIAIRPYLAYQQQSFDNITAANTASQFRQLIDAVKVYVVSACIPSAANNNAIPSGCQNQQINQNMLNTLVGAGYLPAGTTAINPYGQSWYFTVVPTSGGNVQALLYSTGGTQISAKMAAAIAAETGQEGGFVPYPNQYGSSTPTNTAIGAYGHWTAPLPAGAVPGDLVALLNVGVSSYADTDYLYRRQVPGDSTHQLNAMQTDLNMGGNNINNANSVNVVPSTSTTGTPEATMGIDPTGLGGGAVALNDIGSANEAPSSWTNSARLATGSGQALLSLSSNNGAASVNIGANYTGFGSSLKMTSIFGSKFSISEGMGSNVSVTGGGFDASISVGPGEGNSPTTSNTLVLTSVGGTVGKSCSTLNAIAPSPSGPLACSSTPQGPVWMSVGAGFSTTTSVYPAQNTPYTNNSTRPMFVSSNCPGALAVVGGGTGITLTVTSPTGSVVQATNSIGFLALGGGSYVPSSSVIVPPQYSFSYYGQTCSFLVTQ